MTTRTCWLAICVGVVPQLAWAQPVTDRQQQTEELRLQIERLESKLRSLEETDKEKRGIAQIGNTTIRSGDETRLVVRMYDLSELFTVAPPYEARQTSDLTTTERNLFPQGQATVMATGGLGGGLGGGGLGGFGGAFSVPDRPRTVQNDRPAHLGQVEARTSINNLVSAIQSTISPTNWDAAGGAMSISQLGNALIVSADANTHSQIETLLDLFRKRWGTLKTVSVRAWWLPLTENQLNELLPDEKAADERLAFGMIDDERFKRLLDAQQQEGGSIGYRAAITCYNGQTVSAVAGDQTVAVTDVQAVTTKGDANTARPVAYSPVVSLIQEGAALQVTPIVTTSGKYVVLDIHSRVNRRLPDAQNAPPAAALADAAKGGDAPAEVVAALDRPRLNVQRLSTTLRVPVRSTMLIGGMTMNDTATANDPTLYLFVKLIVQELRDGKQGEAAADKQPTEAKQSTAPTTDKTDSPR
jgi:type II secretory pathway component GspD/PulD (secretin)